MSEIAIFRQLRPSREHNVRVTPKRAFWEAFATVCLPSLVLWTIFAYLLRVKVNLSYAEALPIYLFLALLPMPLAFPLYRRYLKGTPRNTKTLSPKANLVLAILFAVAGLTSATALLELLLGHKYTWEAVLHAASATLLIVASVEYGRRATGKRPLTSA
jgi:hypothetical protein